jgi:hypothetical protein
MAQRGGGATAVTWVRAGTQDLCEGKPGGIEEIWG